VDVALQFYRKRKEVKQTVHPKMKMWSSFNQPQIVPNQFFFCGKRVILTGAVQIQT